MGWRGNLRRNLVREGCPRGRYLSDHLTLRRALDGDARISSETFCYEAIAARTDDERPYYVYYLGDFDRAGQDAARSLQEKPRRFADEDGIELVFEAIAVTREQITKWKLPTRKPKRISAADRNWPQVTQASWRCCVAQKRSRPQGSCTDDRDQNRQSVGSIAQGARLVRLHANNGTGGFYIWPRGGRVSDEVAPKWVPK